MGAVDRLVMEQHIKPMCGCDYLSFLLVDDWVPLGASSEGSCHTNMLIASFDGNDTS